MPLSPYKAGHPLHFTAFTPLWCCVFRPLSFQMDNEVKACGALCLLLVCHDV